MIKKKLLGLVCAIAICSIGTTCYAKPGQDDFSGMAVFRDGVLVPGDILWHGGIFAVPRLEDSYRPIIHIGGYGDQVDLVTYDDFIDGNNSFRGVYEMRGMDSRDREDVLHTARDLVTENIDYTFGEMLDYKGDVGKYISPKEIHQLRCDGVVEYAYEWNSIEVRGYGSDWDISNAKSCDEHNRHALVDDPKDLASYMTKVSSYVD